MLEYEHLSTPPLPPPIVAWLEQHPDKTPIEFALDFYEQVGNIDEHLRNFGLEVKVPCIYNLDGKYERALDNLNATVSGYNKETPVLAEVTEVSFQALSNDFIHRDYNRGVVPEAAFYFTTCVRRQTRNSPRLAEDVIERALNIHAALLIQNDLSGVEEIRQLLTECAVQFGVDAIIHQDYTDFCLTLLLQVPRADVLAWLALLPTEIRYTVRTHYASYPVTERGVFKKESKTNLAFDQLGNITYTPRFLRGDIFAEMTPEERRDYDAFTTAILAHYRLRKLQLLQSNEQ